MESNHNSDDQRKGKVNTADTLRSTSGKGTFINAGRHGGGDTGGAFLDRLSNRLERQKEDAEHAAKKFKETGLLEFSEDGKYFYIDGEAYKANILGYFWAFVKGKGSKLK